MAIYPVVIDNLDGCGSHREKNAGRMMVAVFLPLSSAESSVTAQLIVRAIHRIQAEKLQPKIIFHS